MNEHAGNIYQNVLALKGVVGLIDEALWEKIAGLDDDGTLAKLEAINFSMGAIIEKLNATAEALGQAAT